MKKIFYCFVIFCCLNFIDVNADEGILPHLVSRNIVNEISPFIDEDTALVCFVDLNLLKDCRSFVQIARKISQSASTPKRLQFRLSLIESSLEKPLNDPSNIANLTVLNPLTENGVTHLYIVVNMKDTKFGAYFVIPNVKVNSDSAKKIEQFFGIKQIANDNDNAEDKVNWAVYKNGYMIVGGSNSVLSYFATVYYNSIEQTVLALFAPGMANAICGFNNLDDNERQKYIEERFKNFNACKNENFCKGIEELDDCKMIKSVFLFPDAIAAWELSNLKKMEPPINQNNFNFLNTSRKFIAFGADSTEPKIKLIVQCASKDNAAKFKYLIDDVWWNIANNYQKYLNSKREPLYFGADKAKPLTAEEWADVFVAFLPKQADDKLILNIDKNFELNVIKRVIKKP